MSGQEARSMESSPLRRMKTQKSKELSFPGAGEIHLGFSGGQMVKIPPAMWETWVWSLGREDPLEEGMATHSSILAWRIPWREEPGGL